MFIVGSVTMDYIHKWKKGFMIGKQVNGKYYYFGNYQTLEKAKKVRDYFVEHDWDISERFKFMDIPPTRYLRKTRAGNYKIVKWLNGKMEYFGTFHNLEDAMLERDLLVESDWDLDVLCECSDEGNVWEINGIKSSWTKHEKWNDYFTAKRSGIL